MRERERKDEYQEVHVLVGVERSGVDRIQCQFGRRGRRIGRIRRVEAR